MAHQPRDRDILVVCAGLVGLGLFLFAVGAVLDGFDLVRRVLGR